MVNNSGYDQKIAATTLVGSYPDGATPEGLHDLLGNVWEWMDNWYDENKQFRSMRGGSWFNDADALRCSSRSGSCPGYSRYGSIGFRVVRSSHFFSS
ncbi:MAG: SUMF1/EgtB/PvdO family nonheme iron enzyme [Pelodictyon phaeoclathratiforme]